jgi:UDP:flavonoid glycosyltransferase YjiC (YdhE family)
MKPRRYLFAVVDGGGNVPPELSAARRLVARGHAVTVLAEDSVASEVRGTGAALRRWAHAPNRPDRAPDHDPVRDWECTYPWQLADRLVATLFVGPAAAYAQDVSDAIREARPDLVACSMFCFGGMVAAEAARIPFDVVLPNVYPFPAPGLPPFGLGLQPARGVPGRFRDRVLNSLGEHLWDAKGLLGLNALRHRFDLPPLARFFEQLGHARRQLIMTSASFDFPARLPDYARYVGPVLDEPAWAASSRWTAPAGDTPLVLVALSSTFQDQIDCLQRIVDALSQTPVRAVVTTGPAVDPTALRPSRNVAIVQSAPHREVLWQAALVITHGGHGTVMKALAAGVPMVVLPHGRDQADTAARVTARGAGVALARTASPGAISRAVQQVLQHHSYRAAARHLGEVIRRDAEGNTLIQELEDLTNTDHPRNDANGHGPREQRVPFRATSAKSPVSRVSVVALAALLVLASHAFALDKYKAAYVGGTLAQFQYANDHAQGRLDFGDASHFSFTADRHPAEGRRVRVAYASIQDLEFGQKVSRRAVTTMGAAALAGPMALLARPASRRHHLTITFLDEERRSQVVILELGKDIVRSTLNTLEARSGKPIEYRDEAARKWIRE